MNTQLLLTRLASFIPEKLKLALLFSFIILYVTKSNACTCSSQSIVESRDNSVKHSDLIFIGRVIDIDTIRWTYAIEILEVFKGNITNKVIASALIDSVNISSCNFWPNLQWGDDYLIYANKTKGMERIFVDHCSSTRSISNPQIHQSYFLGKYEKMQESIYKDMSFHEKIRALKIENDLKQIAYKDLIDELIYLRKLKEKYSW